jgi:[acyl-carrier-protein] S-malonyltransferase
MKHAFIFPGQGAQFPGMGKELFTNHENVKHLFLQADSILGFNISDVMFSGTAEDLKQTNITQPAVFIHSIAALLTLQHAHPDMVAGHSLGEFSALVAAKALRFEDALRLVSIRSSAMQRACDMQPSTMAAILGLDDSVIEITCKQLTEETGNVVVAANYNSPGQLVISGSVAGVEMACEKLKSSGAKRALILPVGGAFHSPLMLPAKEELETAINESVFSKPICPVYQNINAKPVTERAELKQNLIAQLTGPVKWTQTIKAMISDGATQFTECGPGKVLQGLVQKINKEMVTQGAG